MIFYHICILIAYVIITAVSTSSYFVTFGTTSPINYFNVFVIDGQLFGWREIVLYCNAINVCRITSILYHKKYKLLSRILLFMYVHGKLTILYWFAQSSLVFVFIPTCRILSLSIIDLKKVRESNIRQIWHMYIWLVSIFIRRNALSKYFQ